MKKYIFIVASAMITCTMQANFMVQNNSFTFHFSLYDAESRETVSLGSIPHDKTGVIKFDKDITLRKGSYILFESPAAEISMLLLTIPSDAYGELLKKADKFMPLFTISDDPQLDIFINGPKTEQELQEAIKKAQFEPMHKEVCAGLPQMPHGGGKGIPGIISEYALEGENE